MAKVFCEAHPAAEQISSIDMPLAQAQEEVTLLVEWAHTSMGQIVFCMSKAKAIVSTTQWDNLCLDTGRVILVQPP